MGVRRFHWDSGEEQASLIKTSERGNPRSQPSLSRVAEPQGQGPTGRDRLGSLCPMCSEARPPSRRLALRVGARNSPVFGL